MSKTQELPTLKVGSIFTLIDSTWGMLFPTYYQPFKGTKLPRHVARVKVLGINEGTYTLMLMEIAPEEGRLHAPVGVTSDCSLHDIELAMALSNKKRR